MGILFGESFEISSWFNKNENRVGVASSVSISGKGEDWHSLFLFVLSDVRIGQLLISDSKSVLDEEFSDSGWNEPDLLEDLIGVNKEGKGRVSGRGEE